MSVIAVVPARSGSKGLPHKNIASLGGVTLLELAIQVGLHSRCVDDIYVSTDSSEYVKIAVDAGATVVGLRPEELSGDYVKTSDVIIDLLGKVNKTYDYLVLLQPTSPIRSSEDIDKAFAMLETFQADAVVSVEILDEPHPEKVKRIDNNNFLTSYILGTSSEMPRQQLPEAYRLNGAIYIIRISTLLAQRTLLPARTIAYKMPRGVNIDSEIDLIMLKTLHKLGRLNLIGVPFPKG